MAAGKGDALMARWCVAAWIEYIFGMLLVGFLTGFFASYAMLLLLVLCGTLPFLSFWIGAYLKRHTGFSVRARARLLDKGGENDIFICLFKERAGRPGGLLSLGTVLVWLEIRYLHEAEGRRLRLELPVRPERHEISLPVAGKYCGAVRVTAQEAVYAAPFHLFLFRKKLDASCDYMIVPKGRAVPVQEQSAGGLGYEAFLEEDAAGDNSSEIRDLDFYQPGDRMQKIHWKASARKEEWMVKEYAGTFSREVTLLVELAGSAEAFDAVMELAYGFMLSQMDAFGKVTLVYWEEGAGLLRRRSLCCMEEVEDALQELLYAPHAEAGRGYGMFRAAGEGAGGVFYIGLKDGWAGAGGKELAGGGLAGLWLLETG